MEAAKIPKQRLSGRPDGGYRNFRVGLAGRPFHQEKRENHYRRHRRSCRGLTHHLCHRSFLCFGAPLQPGSEDPGAHAPGDQPGPSRPESDCHVAVGKRLFLPAHLRLPDRNHQLRPHRWHNPHRPLRVEPFLHASGSRCDRNRRNSRPGARQVADSNFINADLDQPRGFSRSIVDKSTRRLQASDRRMGTNSFSSIYGLLRMLTRRQLITLIPCSSNRNGFSWPL